MFTYEAAYKKAREIKSNIEGCTEYEDAYVFWGGDEFEIGGSSTPRVIYKNDGRMTTMNEYVINGSGKELGDRQLPVIQVSNKK